MLRVVTGLFVPRVLGQALVAFLALRLQRRETDNPERPSRMWRIEGQGW